MLKNCIWTYGATYTKQSLLFVNASTLIPLNSQFFGSVTLEKMTFSAKSGFQILYLLNIKNSDLEKLASLETQAREG